MQNGNYVVFETLQGWIGISGSARGLSHSTLPQHSRETATALLGEETRSHAYNPSAFQSLIAKYQDYFNGERVEFSDTVDLSAGSPFQREVWKATRLIQYGETRSYGWLAVCLDKPQSPRAVGQALGKNPLPVIIPCHRVIGADGRLCGFTGGLDMKQKLLSIEHSMVKIIPVSVKDQEV
jgi:methylated-DNA-[protein]-cysteine S-methyltransferase